MLVCAFDAYHIEIDRPLLHLLVEQRTALAVVASEESAVKGAVQCQPQL